LRVLDNSVNGNNRTVEKLCKEERFLLYYFPEFIAPDFKSRKDTMSRE
jgi:hypothetical protein